MHLSMVVSSPPLGQIYGRNALHCSLQYNFNVVNISGLKFDAGKYRTIISVTVCLN